HPFGMDDRVEQRRLGPAADGLGRAVLALKLGKVVLEQFKPAHHGVVLGVRDERGILLVVRVAQFEDAGRQGVSLCGSLLEVFRSGLCGALDALCHPLSLGNPSDTIGGVACSQAETGTALTVRSMVHCPSTRVPT